MFIFPSYLTNKQIIFRFWPLIIHFRGQLIIVTSLTKFTMDERKKSSCNRSTTDLTQGSLRDASRSKFSCKFSELLQELHQDQDIVGPLLLNLGNDSLEEITDEDSNDETPEEISVLSFLSSPLDVSSDLDFFSSPITVRYVSDEEDSLDTALVRSSSTSLSTSSSDSEPTASGSTRREHSNVTTSNEGENVEADAEESRTSSSSADSSRSSSVDEEDYDADLSGSSSDSCQRRCKRIKLS